MAKCFLTSLSLKAVNLFLEEKDYTELQEVIWTDSAWIGGGKLKIFP